VKVAPTARDLSVGLFEYHLDFPGNALSPKCTYDEWSHAIKKGSKPTVYARVVTERAHPGQLALQYWLFYVFNFVNLISSLVYVFALPFVAIATTYLYFDLELEKGEQPEREAVAVPAPT
jgi:hypothetical protein